MINITHDSANAASAADRVAAMYLGEIVEIGPVKVVLKNPQHPTTGHPVSVIPVANPRMCQEDLILQGETRDPIDLPTGCHFHPGFPDAIQLCSKVEPQLEGLGDDHQTACLLVTNKNALDRQMHQV